MLFRSLSEPLRVLWDSELPVYSPVVRGPAKTSKMGCLLGNSAICCPKEGGLIGLRRTFKASFGAQRTSGLKRAAVPTVCDANARDVQPLAVAKSRNVMFGEALHRHNLRRRSCGVANAGIAELAQAGGQALDIASLLEIRGVRDAGAFTIAIVGALGLVKLFRYLASRDLLERKLSRKLVHLLAGPGLVACWPLFSDYPEARFVAALVPFLNLIRLSLVGSGIIQDEAMVKSVSREGDRNELLQGPSYYAVILIAVTLLFWRNSLVGFATISVMCGGDGLADIIGRRLGTAKLPWNKDKSWAGSLAMFGGGTLMTVAMAEYFSALGYFTINFPVLPVAAFISLCAAIVESLPINTIIDDNISVPLVATGLAVLLMESVTVLT